jgi:type III pantothenate kinase
MGRRILTIDLGNSRAKLALLVPSAADAAELVGEASFETGPGLTRAVETWLERTPEIASALLSSVAPLALEDELAHLLARRFGAEFRRNPAVKLAIDYEPRGSLGRDRLYAARGAVQIARSDAVVVDAGTALTVDAVRMGETPRFLGGAIAPGPRLLADALHRHTARLPLVEPKEGAPALAHDTQAALQAGIVVGFRGAAAELVRRVAEEARVERTALVVVTGGARGLLLRPTSCFGERRVVEDPLLVHRGLLAALADSP